MSALRLSLFNPQAPDHPVAERELAQRLLTALERLGWHGAIHTRSAEIEGFDPDAVINLYPEAAPKLTGHPWLGCAWNPVGLVARLTPPARAGAARNLPAQDGYLVSGTPLSAHLQRLRPDAPQLAFHPSSPRSDLAPNLGPDSRLFYVGSNWDGQRFPLLLKRLAEAGALALHGTAERWSHLADAWQGPLPFDGTAVIKAAHRWGMGLCLHLPQHRAEAVPNMRVFELAAAGAVIIADRHPFIEQWFGDRVLYVDTDGGEEATAAAILSQVDWVRAHPDAARTMATAAQALFNRHLCLEALLSPLPGLLADLAARRAPTRARRVGVLLPGGDPGPRLARLANQRQAGLSITALVPTAEGAGMAPAGVTLHPLTGAPGMAGLRAGLSGLDALAILPEGVVWPAGFLARLVAGRLSGGGAVLTAGLWPRPGEETGFPLDPAEDRALCPQPGTPVPPEQALALALLRAAGFCVGVERLAGLEMGGDDWLSLALNLPPLLAGEGGGVDWQPVPGPRLEIGIKAGALAGIDSAHLRPWPDRPILPGDEWSAHPPRLSALNDLSPALAATIPFLCRAEEFADLPGAGSVWLYGTGRGGALVLEALGPAARHRLAGFLDSSRTGSAHGLPLWRPGDIDPAAMGTATIIIAAQYVSDMLRLLAGLPTPPAHIINAYPFIAAQVEAAS